MKNRLSKEDKDRLGVKIFIGVVIAFIILVVSFFYIKSSLKGYDKNTLCINEQVVEKHNILIIDTTDALSKFQSIFLKKQIEDMVNNAKTNDRFSVYTIDSFLGGASKKLFDMCVPNTGADMNPVYENPKLAERKFKKTFYNPILELISKLEILNSQNRSPITSAISDIFKLKVFDSNANVKEVYLYSDLLENTKTSSIYKGDMLPSMSVCEKQESIDMFTISLFEGQGRALKLQSKALIKQWVSFLEPCTEKLVFNRVRH